MAQPVRSLARPMLASMFVIGGIDQLTHAREKVDVAEDVTEKVAEPLHLGDVPTQTLVQLNGAAQVVGGLALALGKMPRLASAVLASSLIPTTAAAHRFWELEDEKARQTQQVQFFKNVSMFGGLLLAVLDRGGREGTRWAARRKAREAAIHARHVGREATLATKLAAAETNKTLGTAVSSLAEALTPSPA